MISWHSFPVEIRLLVLEALLQDSCSLAGFATVSREWQAIIERHNFSRIKLTSSRLADFGLMVHRNRSLTRYIWLCLELQEYDCTECDPQDPESMGLSNADNALIATAFLDLFSSLSAWEPDGGKLVLDISVYSPSDSEHWLKYLTFEPDDDHASDVCGRRQYVEQSMLLKASDHHHGWIAGSQCSMPTSTAVDKVFDEIMGEGPFENEEQEMQWWQQLPLVPAVTGVLLFFFIALQSLFESLASDRLRRLVLFENFNQSYHTSYINLSCDPIRIPSSHVSRAVANASRTLEHLSASFMVDASHFFDARQPSWKWPSLTWLALTSRLLAPEASSMEMDDMLRAAAAAAMKMPNLKTMEIWNGKDGLAMLFSYQRAERGQPAVISWRGTWELPLRPPVIQTWDSVVLRHRGQGHVIVKELLDAGAGVKSHGDAIRRLRLSRPVIRPVSLRQIQLEHMIREGVQSQ